MTMSAAILCPAVCTSDVTNKAGMYGKCIQYVTSQRFSAFHGRTKTWLRPEENLKKKREKKEKRKKQRKGIFTVLSVVINLYLATMVICLNVFIYMSYVELSFACFDFHFKFYFTLL